MTGLPITIALSMLTLQFSQRVEKDTEQPVSWMTNLIQSVAFSPRGDLVACGHLNGKVTLWNPRSAHLTATLALPLRKGDSFREAYAVAFSPDGKLIAAGGSRSGGQISSAVIAIWDIRSRKLIRELEGIGYTSSMAFAPDGRTIAIAEGHTRSIRLWDARTGKVSKILSAPRNEMVSVAFSPDGRLIAGGTASLDVHTEGDIILWDARTGQRKWLRNLPGAYVLRLAFSRNGDRIFGGLTRWRHPAPAASQPFGEVAAWNTATGKNGVSWSGITELVSGLRVSRDGRLLAYCGYGDNSEGRADSGILAIIDAGSLRTRHIERRREPILDVAFSPDSKLITVATETLVRIVPLGLLENANH